MVLQEDLYLFVLNANVSNDESAVAVVAMGGHVHKKIVLEADVLAHSIGYNSYLKTGHTASEIIMI